MDSNHALETLLRSVRQIGLSAAGQGERRVYRVWFWLNERDHLATGRTVNEALTAAVAELQEQESRRVRTRRPG